METMPKEDAIALQRQLDKKVHDEKLYWVVKRCFDLVMSLLAVIVLSPLMLIVALIIVIDDPHGGPLFAQDRVGRGGKVFKFYKFRSMVVNAEELLEQLKDKNEKDGPAFKIKDDPRITRIGRFIRKTSIDELPQLFNILKGDMSIVGPRPPLPREVEKYDEYAKIRLLVTPGLTCYWQTQHNRDLIGFDEWMDLDVKYIKERTWWLDIKLIVQTVIVSILGRGH